jgi:hypothetical protein
VCISEVISHHLLIYQLRGRLAWIIVFGFNFENLTLYTILYYLSIQFQQDKPISATLAWIATHLNEGYGVIKDGKRVARILM